MGELYIVNSEFNNLDISAPILKAIDKMGFDKMTKIQQEAIPQIIAGNDVVGVSHTGTGKTLAFAIPAIQMIDKNISSHPQVLVLCPTRELAVQTFNEFKKLYAYDNFVKAAAIYGGENMVKQIGELKKGANIIIGTPGRVQDHINRRTLKLDNIKMFVLDEADEMLNMGFKEDIELILSSVPQKRQTLLFSATMPQAIKDIIANYLTCPVYINIENKTQVLNLIEQLYFDIEKGRKKDALILLINYYMPSRAIVFCNTKLMVDELADFLTQNKINAIGLHGDMSQNARNLSMQGFKSSKNRILIATDVAARGIDIYDVDIVFNFDLPQSSEYYMHRIGRTGRAGKTGLAITLISSAAQQRSLLDIKKEVKSDIKKSFLPKPGSIKDKMVDSFIEELKIFMSKNNYEKYIKHVKHLSEQGYTEQNIAAALIAMNSGTDSMFLPSVYDRSDNFEKKPKDNFKSGRPKQTKEKNIKFNKKQGRR